MKIWLIIIVLGAVNFVLRGSFIMTQGGLALPQNFENALRYVPAAALSAIIFPAVLMTDAGTVSISLGNERLLAALIAGAIAWRSKNMFLTIAVGMAVLWMLQAL